ncbi:MAG: hypothetical protein M1814_000077 [Vezdaea aestivalis]|nr:MAG: hypothetical protein M1814_000077 [Vezdaea aestivalis]
MLLIHQTGSVKVGEVVRFTITYTPSQDRILPHPETLHVRIKNTSAIPLRAAYLHGPYTLYVACFPTTFNPNGKTPLTDGTPQFESNLKAGGSWGGSLHVPEHIRADNGDENKSVSWVVEVASQIIFSTSAQVHFEVSVGRDAQSLSMGVAAVLGPTARISDRRRKNTGVGQRGNTQSGVYSKSIRLEIEDTDDLWNKPEFPGANTVKSKSSIPSSASQDSSSFPQILRRRSSQASGKTNISPPKPPKKVHLVIITHGLHSNTGADMLFLKESIDTAAKQARVDAKARKATENAPSTASKDQAFNGDDAADDEEVIVRGYPGNAVKTEKGIKYLGKRLAKYILSMTFPSQPFLPMKKSGTKSLTFSLGGASSAKPVTNAGPPAHSRSTVRRAESEDTNLPYKVTSISLVGHSLGGLIQMYAIGYIQKHSPTFFDQIKPINFIAMASPFLGLSNENPIYIRFALDFGVVGRTGQDLGLTWRAPNIARSGWDAMVGGMGGGSGGKKSDVQDPEAKPLLRILPTGPAHHVLRKFRNRTLYSNVVNDGIVPLRTSCLLFLDWRGLGRVQKARRENGLVGTMVGWGWAEMTGANSTNAQRKKLLTSEEVSIDNASSDGIDTPQIPHDGTQVPQPPESATKEDNADQAPAASQFLRRETNEMRHTADGEHEDYKKTAQAEPAFSNFWNFFSPRRSKSPHTSPKSTKIYKRSQTIRVDTSPTSEPSTKGDSTGPNTPISPVDRPRVTRGDTQLSQSDSLFAPPRTTVFESAGDILNPPIPSDEFILDPESRPRAIFHDRVYHADDIPPPPIKPRSSSGRSVSSQSSGNASKHSRPPTTPNSMDSVDSSGMKVEERIARAYHRDLSWRKVLVRLEPDAHNNMVVRRMFSNAYGWPVIKHLCDTHFADTYTARTSDEVEPSTERSKSLNRTADRSGTETEASRERAKPARTNSELNEEIDELGALRPADQSARRSRSIREDSGQWSDHYFEVTDDEDEDDDMDNSRPTSPAARAKPRPKVRIADDPAVDPDAPRGTTQAEIAAFLTSSPVGRPEGLTTGLDARLEGVKNDSKGAKRTAMGEGPSEANKRPSE